MSFGRNPHVAKAEAEELKAATAKDSKAMELAWREAARQWERAADREKDGKRRADYAAKAEAARANADGDSGANGTDATSEPTGAAPPVNKLLVN
jgi:hypothetical protein